MFAFLSEGSDYKRELLPPSGSSQTIQVLSSKE